MKKRRVMDPGVKQVASPENRANLYFINLNPRQVANINIYLDLWVIYFNLLLVIGYVLIRKIESKNNPYENTSKSADNTIVHNFIDK